MYRQNVRSIGLFMFQYAIDNNGEYPDGKSSTEVFQKLIDEKYVESGDIFYIPMPGKIKPPPGQKLKPENVSYDVTVCHQSDSEYVPLVFSTGYKVTYIPEGSAISLIKPYPRYGDRTWSEWLPHKFEEGHEDPIGIAVCYAGNNAGFLRLPHSNQTDNLIPNFVPLRFNPTGETYLQLTPTGPLP